jgi:hypothetical protein
MNRLVHSKGGLLRAFDISKARVFAFVEGGLDRLFIDRVLDVVCDATTPYEVRAARDIPDSAGGKVGLVGFFKELQESNSLLVSRWGERKVVVFFADKDIDDHTNKLINSEHFIYTETYDLEGHLVQCGNLAKAISEATLITRRQAEDLIGEKSEFLQGVAIACLDWVTLCVLSHLKEVNAGCGYSMNPPLVLRAANDLDLDLDLNLLSERLCQRMGGEREEFDILFAETRALIEGEMRKGFYFKYFKGKWFSDILQKFATATIKIPDVNLSNVGDRVLQSLVSQMPNGENCPCSKGIFDLIRPVIARVA